MNKYKKGCIFLVIALVFNLIESLYFGRTTTRGFNWLPESGGELTCDVIAMIIALYAFYLITCYFVELAKEEKDKE